MFPLLTEGKCRSAASKTKLKTSLDRVFSAPCGAKEAEFVFSLRLATFVVRISCCWETIIAGGQFISDGYCSICREIIAYIRTNVVNTVTEFTSIVFICTHGWLLIFWEPLNRINQGEMGLCTSLKKLFLGRNNRVHNCYFVEVWS